MKYSDIIKKYKLNGKQKRALLPVRKKKHDFVVMRRDWLEAVLRELGGDGFKQTSRVLLALLLRLSSKEYKRVVLNDLRYDLGAKRMEVERAMSSLCEKKIILNESDNGGGKNRSKYFKFNPDFAEIDSDVLDEIDDDFDEYEELNKADDLDESEES